MTTIAVDKNYTIASDGNSSVGTIITNQTKQKVHKVEDDWVMGSGTTVEVLEFVDWYKGDKSKKPDLYNCTILVLSKKQLYTYQQTKSGNIYPVKQSVPWAVGSGGEVAIGAMLAGATAEEAVRLTSTVDAFTGGRIKVYNK